MALEKPGPPVKMPTAGLPVMRAYPSAICSAAPSCRVSMNWIPSSSAASTSGRMVSPTMVNTFSIPSCFRQRRNRCPPVSFAIVPPGRVNAEII